MNIFALLFDESGGGLFSVLPMIAIMIGIFYFLVIRPNQKQQQTLKEMVASLKAGDEVVTNGGIIGKIKEVRENSFIIQSAEKSFLEVGKSAVIGKKAEEVKK
ncbi:MAG: preprotein translocase subunit YajC [Pyrinomonadaceae bacterium]